MHYAEQEQADTDAAPEPEDARGAEPEPAGAVGDAEDAEDKELRELREEFRKGVIAALCDMVRAAAGRPRGRRISPPRVPCSARWSGNARRLPAGCGLGRARRSSGRCCPARRSSRCSSGSSSRRYHPWRAQILPVRRVGVNTMHLARRAGDAAANAHHLPQRHQLGAARRALRQPHRRVERGLAVSEAL